MESATNQHGQHAAGQADAATYPLYGAGVGVGVGVAVGGAGLGVDTGTHTHAQTHPSTQTQPQPQPPAHLHPLTHSQQQQQQPLERPAQQQQQQQQQQANSTGPSNNNNNTLNLINLMGSTANMQTMSSILSQQHSHPNPYSMQYSATATQAIAFPSDLIHQQPQPRQGLHLQPLQKHSLHDVSSFSPVDQNSSVTSFESPTIANPIIAPAADGASETGSPIEGNMMADMSDSCLFRRSVQKCHIWNADKSKSYDIELKPLIDRGFFMTEGNWTCYRRNYFQLSSSFSITESATENGANYASISGNGNTGPSSTTAATAAPSIDSSAATPLPSLSPYFLEIKERLVPITNFLTHMSAYACSSTDGTLTSQGPVELVQHTSKRDKGELTQPVPRVTDKDQRITFERIQFRTATNNNGRRRVGDQHQPVSARSNGTSVSGGPLAQQFFIVVVEVLCKVASGEFYKVCESEMDRGVVVRGRAPGHYVARDQGAISGADASAAGTPRLSTKRSIKGVEAIVTKVEQQQQQQQQQLDSGYVNFGTLATQQNLSRAQTAAQQIPGGLYPYQQQPQQQQQQQQRPNQFQSQPQTPVSMPLPSPVSRPPTIPELMVAQERERAKQNTSQMYTSFYGNGGAMQQPPQQQPALQQFPYATTPQHSQHLQHLQPPHQQQQQPQYPTFMQQHQPHQQVPQSQLQQPQQQQQQQPLQQQSYPYQQQHRPGPAPQQQPHSSAMNLGFGFPSQPQAPHHAYPLLTQQPPLQHQHHQQTQQQQQQQQQQLYPSAQYPQYSPGYSQMQLQLQYQQQQQQQQHRNQFVQFQQQQHMRHQHVEQLHAQNQAAAAAAAAVAEAKAQNSVSKSKTKKAAVDDESEEFEEPDDSDDDYKPRGGARSGVRGGRSGGRPKR
ncbi:hypothetical protein HDU77_006142 [Chytriomyces hyalinus]|nr:hypothetical protein HDU77_006142 [Chytriomyces hyalinus]